MSFDPWLSDRNIDCQHLTPTLEQSLLAQHELDYQRNAPTTEVLIVPADCSWPASGYWVPVVVSQ